MPDELKGQLCMGEVAAMIEEHREKKYQAFVDKFKEAKTTDDCYTPPEIYDAIADWVAKEYGIGRERFLRPFKPGGDYQAEKYPEGCAVVDNPPFSMLAQIVDWYISQSVPFFLFGPTLTLLGLMKRPERKEKICVVLIGNGITYENGAEVQTSYVTNMDTYAVRIEAGLRATLEAINNGLQRQRKKELPKYTYPDYILTGKDYRLAKWGQTLRIKHEDCVSVSELDAQRPMKKSIFGGGLLLSERAKTEREAAEKAANERAAMGSDDEAQAIEWELSAREWEIIQNLPGGGMLNAQHRAPKTPAGNKGQQQTMF